jgi:hypothetical protein
MNGVLAQKKPLIACKEATEGRSAARKEAKRQK